MKRVVSLLIMTVLIFGVFCSAPLANAAAIPEQSEIISLENGDYLEITINNIPVQFSGISALAATKSVTKMKTTKYRNSSGTVLWSISIKATFTYDGSTSKCTACSHSTTCPAKTWTIKSASSSKSGNSATAKATATHATNGALKNYTQSVTIKCSKNGTVS
ncbi:MAG: hypothetical protein NC489_35845 [Ruminococcus flavefaciens]|nr:hypothetical protein [Ruminococcus flavefaciens]